ncbi:MAG: PIG-L family deacetylase [Candidatus Sulfotelmatobacter sp.]
MTVGIFAESAELVRIGATIGLMRMFFSFEHSERHSEKLGYSDFEVRSRDAMPDVTKIMIVAHPDDESLFGGETLTSSEGWLVICVTNASNETRRAEFIRAMCLAGADYLMLDHADHFTSGNFDPALAAKLARVLAEIPSEIVVTHGATGEYGHRQHRALHRIVRRLVPTERLFTFATRWLARPHISAAKQRLLDCYVSQDSIERFRYMSEREFLRPSRPIS